MNILSGKDLLTQSVEAASGGNVTVMYDDKNLPCYMRRIPAFNLEDINPSLGTGLHPAFIVNGVAKSEIWIGQYQAIVHDGVALSLPNQIPATGMNYDQAITYCRNKGAGWHLMTNAEWAAIMLWCYKNDTIPRGNTYWGRNEEAAYTYESGVRGDGGALGSTTGDGKTFTGSGPVSWRHDLTNAGLADLVGNVWEWNAGMALQDGEIRILPDNDAANQLTGATMDAASGWRAFDANGNLTDTLVQSGTTLKFDSVSPRIDDGEVQNVGVPQLDTQIDNPLDTDADVDGDYAYGPIKSLGVNSTTLPDGIPAALKVYGLAALGDVKGHLWMRNNGLRVPLRGGIWNNASNAGLGALNLSIRRSNAYWSVGFRPTFVA